MRRELAERLLAKIMEWDTEEKAFERGALEVFATYKYDEYQQFEPGRRFLESLALWLHQFDTLEEKKIAYKFLRTRLVYISESEISHLVNLAFSIVVRPHLILATAGQVSGISPYQVKNLTDTDEYKINLRRTLFLGLTDGARTDRFRRANPQSISNEQIWHAYDISNAKVKELRKKLRRDLDKQNHCNVDDTFQTVILLDDFTASGKSYLRLTNNGDWTGKIDAMLNLLEDDTGLGSLLATSGVKIIVILYVASSQATEYIRSMLARRGFERGEIEFKVVHELEQKTKLSYVEDAGILSLVNNDDYWDENIDDEHAAVGSGSFRYGFDDCHLPVVLSHNTPNNSIFLLWAEESSEVNGLFPRVSRHRKFE